MKQQRRYDVAIVGAGVIGLAVAWRIIETGRTVAVIDPTPARGASWLAGGMLAPITEAWPGEDDVLHLGERSLRCWPEFASQLTVVGGDPGLATAGTILAALDSADAGTIELMADYLRGLGRAVDVVPASKARRLEPGLSGSVRKALLAPDDLAVDNRKLLAALETAASIGGAEFIRESAIEVHATGVTTERQAIAAERVVLTAGAWSARLHPSLAGQVRPLKGEILRLRARRGTVPPPSRTVRAFAEGKPLYLVPRDGAELVLGATQYEAGFDHTVTAGGVRELVEHAERVFPALVDYELVEAAAGPRASSPDNLPLIGELADGVLVAAGHHRNGLLLAPITAEAIVALLAGEPMPDEVLPANPRRQLERTERV